MASTKCAKCGGKLTPFNRNPLALDTHQDCDQVARASGDETGISQGVEPSIGLKSSLNLGPFDVPRSSEKLQSHEARIAIESARIVNTYGTLIQIVGRVFGLVNAASGFYLASNSGNVGWAIGGVLFGLVTIFLCAVQGAVFRLISNYVVARLKG